MNRDASNNDAPIAVTGATGYVGGRLVSKLLLAGYRVRCLVRCPEKLSDRPFYDDDRVEILACDLEDEERTAKDLSDCRAAYFLVHSMMAAGRSYAEADRRIARAFANAASTAGIQQIIYLGGLGETGEGLSEHLKSRRDVELELASGKSPLTVLRAAMIIGSGSASFEILRYLVERLPLMVTPRWVTTKCQPIGIRGVAREAAAQVIVDAALTEIVERQGDGVAKQRRAAGTRRWRPGSACSACRHLWAGPISPGLA